MFGLIADLQERSMMTTHYGMVAFKLTHIQNV